MHDDDARLDLTAPDDHRVVVADGWVEVRSTTHHRSGSNDYTNEGREMVAVVDNQGNVSDDVWADQVVELAEGLEAFVERGHRCLRVSAVACPVRVRFRVWLEYGSWDGTGTTDGWSKHSWVVYETS